ncbi:patatin [Stylonychia lemnae]|uniref:Patatin n=1 Tax=Stylonychia lemnae TaxID=5949 RepID=A0A078B6D5_STYLE|nr:patatin [Stylonychia lemnae]|eukprot:CDW89786.1 patatin [Stylonychia lemnae]
MVEHITRTTTTTPHRLEKRYTVLSLDGGGVRGLMTTMILASIEEHIRRLTKQHQFKITDAVDCVIGTSAGGLIALGLSSGFSAIELRDDVMNKMIPATFESPLKKVKLLQYFVAASTSMYNEKNLEEQLRKVIHTKLGYKETDKVTLAHLKANNTKLRTCITAVAYHYDDKKGPSFTPRIFDTENELDLGKTIIEVGRSTSAAPVYFMPQTVEDRQEDDSVESTRFVDGGLFANNPAGWGFALAALKVKAENVRVISVGTGAKDYDYEEQQKDDDPNFWEKTKDFFNGLKDSLLRKIHVKDSSEKSGALSWANLEIISSAIFDVQKQAEQVLNLYKNVMNGNYIRLNPPLQEDITLDKADPDDIKLMTTEVNRYLDSDQGILDVESAISTILNPEDYQQKILQQLEKAAHLLRYVEFLKQDPNHELKQKQATYLKFMLQKLGDISVTDDDLKQAEEKVENDLKEWGKAYVCDEKYPKIKMQKGQEAESQHDCLKDHRE